MDEEIMVGRIYWGMVPWSGWRLPRSPPQIYQLFKYPSHYRPLNLAQRL